MTKQEWLEKRNKEIIRQVLSGKPYNKVALAYGMCRESIRQIVKKEGHSNAVIFKKKRQLKYEKKLEASEKFANKLGRLPSVEEFSKHLKIWYPEYSAIIRDLRKKGITKTIYDENRERKRKEMLAYLQRFAKRLGHTPGSNDLMAHGKFHPVLYQYYFGCLGKAQRLAGLTPNESGKIPAGKKPRKTRDK